MQKTPTRLTLLQRSQTPFKRKRPKVNFFGVLLALLLFLLIFVLFTAPKISQLSAQNTRINAKTAELKDIKANLSLTAHELEKMKDPEYARRLARDRFLFTDEKETTYSVLQNSTQSQANLTSTQKQEADTRSLKKDMYVLKKNPMLEYLKREYLEAFGIKTAK